MADVTETITGLIPVALSAGILMQTTNSLFPKQYDQEQDAACGNCGKKHKKKKKKK